jgi:hypothetical protein
MNKLYQDLYIEECTLDLEKLTNSCFRLDTHITNMPLFPPDTSAKAPKWKSAKNWEKHKMYNFLSYPFPQIHNLYKTIQNFFYKVEKDYFGENKNFNYWIRSWLNIYYETHYIGWHTHAQNMPDAWHGNFFVDTEPSILSYKFKDDTLYDIECKVNHIVLALSDNSVHRTYPWHDSKKPRITVAFDIIPEEPLNQYFNHRWIPI